MKKWQKVSLVIVVGAALIAATCITALKVNPDLAYLSIGTKYPAVTPITGYGFSTLLTGLSPADLDKRLNDMKATGVTWVRYDLSWALVQPDSSKSYDWSTYDTITKAATAHGFKVLMIIDFAPTWAQAPGCSSDQICQPASAAAYARFASAAATHYQPYGVEAWEIWNEPNILQRFNPAVSPALYTRMLKDAYVAIKRVDPHATVLAGSLSPGATNGSDYAPIDFLKQLYANGAAGYFDALSSHPYTTPISPAESKPTDAWGQLQAEHNLMAARGDGAKQIWATEFGAPTSGPPAKSDGFVSEAFQAQMATDAITLFRTYPWAGLFSWYDYIDAGTTTDTTENFYGLVRTDGSHKPAYDTFVRAISTK